MVAVRAAPALALAVALGLAAPGQAISRQASSAARRGGGFETLLRGGLGGGACFASEQCSGGSPADETEWDYHDGGTSWDIGQCCSGGAQSPIDVAGAPRMRPDGQTLFWAYRIVEDPIVMQNNGHFLTAKLRSDSGLLSLGRDFPSAPSSTYSLWKVDIRTPSEHTFGGRKVDLELQLFHRRIGTTSETPDPDALLVLSIGFTTSGRDSRFLRALGQGTLPRKAGAETTVNRVAPARLDFAELFGPGVAPGGAELGYWQYTGSLTTPPCSIGVQWLVRSDPLAASPATLRAFQQAAMAVLPLKQLSKGNARTLRPSCGRKVMLRQAVDMSSLLDAPGMAAPDDEFASALDRARGQLDKSPSILGELTVHEQCLHDLARTARELRAAKERADMECTGKEQARADFHNLSEADSADARMRAGDRLNAGKALCNEAHTVVQALMNQLRLEKARCDNLR